MLNIDKLREEVLRLGACDYAPSLMRKASTVGDLIGILLDPKSLEFCMNRNFPRMEQMLPFEEQLRNRGVFTGGVHAVKNARKVVVYGGDVHITLSGFDACEVYICGGSVHITAVENSFATVEVYNGALCMHEGNVHVFNKN